MDSVIAFNNKGVYFYEHGDLERASACFSNAALSVGYLRERADNFDDLSLDDMDDDSFCHHYDPIKGWSEPLSADESQEGFSVIFTRLLLLNTCKSINNEPSYEDIDACALVILYNSAVLNHAHSNSKGQISTSTEAAYQGYEQAFITYQRLSDEDISGSFSYHLQILKLALFNNMGVLYHNNFGRFRDAIQCFKSSRKQMMIIEKQVLSDNVVTANELHQLSLNLLVVPVAAAPVA